MVDKTPAPGLTSDDFLGGRLKILQPQRGYRAGVDPVLLAASVPAKPGQTVLELGCGVGVATLCLASRVPDLTLTGLELQTDYADLARRNAAANGFAVHVETGDLSRMPDGLRAQQFDHVIANPPYFDRVSSTPADDPGRETALGETLPLEDWVKQAAKRCASKGHVSFIQRADRLPDLLSCAGRHLGSLEVLPLIPRAGRAARLVILRGRKGGRAGFRLHHGWVLHAGDAHDGDRENYNKATACILRLGAPLPFPA